MHRKPIQVLQEIYIDASRQRSKHIYEPPVKDFDYIITLCSDAAQNCQGFCNKSVKMHQGFVDPAVDQAAIKRFWNHSEVCRVR